MSRPRRAPAPRSYTEFLSSDNEEGSDGFEFTELENPDTSADEADLETLPTAFGPSDKIWTFPPPAEIAEAKKFITEQTEICANIRAEYAAQKKVLIQIQYRLAVSEKSLLERKASIAPIRRLPQEVLSMVFLIHSIEHSQSSWTLMHVCRAWRLAALTTPALWTRIKLTTVTRKEKANKARPRVSDGYEVCSNHKQLIRALQRVGSLPLDLWIFKGDNHWRNLFDGDIVGMITTIKRQISRPRLRSLRIESPRYLPLRDNFDGFDFSDLKVLKVDSSFPDLFKQIAKEAKDIKSLTGVCSDVLLLKDKLSNVDELGLLRPYDTDAASTQRLLVSASRSLTSLTVQGSVIDEHFETTMVCLKRLELCQVPSPWPVVCPGLTHLTIMPWREWYQQDIFLPHLVFLAYTGSSGKFLGCFKVPALHTLELTVDGGKGSVNATMRDIWIQPPNPSINPVVFEVVDSTINSKVLSKVLDAMTNCEELYVRRTRISADLFSSLLPEKRTTKIKQTKKSQNAKSRGTWIIPAPKLRIIVVDMNGCKVKLDEKELWNAASNFVATREIASTPLERLSLFLDSGESKDAVTDDVEAEET